MRTHFISPPVSKSLHLMMILMLLAGMLGFASGPVSADGMIIYVNSNAPGANNGTSWADAYIDLQSALTAAVSSDEIWVAAGTYFPTAGADRTVSFTLKNGVSIYGGFDGTETLLSERDPATNITVLSGDIGVPNDISDNSYHVVNGGGTDNSAVLDGFTITKGNANLVVEFSQEQYGAGMYNVNSSPTLNNLIFTGNTTPRYGAGMYNSASSPKLNNVIFLNNSAQRAGGMYNTNFSNPVLTNVIFSNNTASSRGGGMTTAENSAPILTNVTFSGNTADWGAAIHNTGGFPTFINVTISGNTAEFDGGGLYNDSSTPILTNVTISNNSAAVNGGGIFNDSSNPVITNSIIYGNTGTEIFNSNSTPDVTYSIVEGGHTGTGNLNANPLLEPLADNGGFAQTMALGSTSPAIDAGDDVKCPSTDQRGYTRPQGTHCDMGAYEFDNEPPDTTIGTKPTDPDSDSTPTFTFSGSDMGGSGVASFMCRMDSGGFSPCTSPYTSPALTAGSHTFQVYAIDNTLNADPIPASYTWSLSFTPTLVTSITRLNANPTSAASVAFTVSLSANVTGVGTNDFSLTSTVSGASITSVTGSGNTYTVTVNTGIGNGTIRLNVPLSAVMPDSYGNSPANLPYTSGESYTISRTGTFADVPTSHPYYSDIEILYANGLTGGCQTSPLMFCPDQIMDRAQSAVFMMRGTYGSSYVPPAGLTYLFKDNWSPGTWARPWAEAMRSTNLTTGCQPSPLLYCPWVQLPREQLVIFGLKMKYGNNYQPPAATGQVFADLTDTGYYATPWAEKAYADGLITACGTSGGKPKFCPSELVSRGLGAYVIVRAKNLSIP